MIKRFPGFWLTLLFIVAADVAAKQSCEKCKFAPCLKGQIERKQQLVAAYEAIASELEGLFLDDGRPVAVVDFASISDESQRSASYVDLLKKLGLYEHKVSSATGDIPFPTACCEGGPAEVSTDDLTCVTDQKALKAAQRVATCREIADLLDRHEGVHRQACQIRKRNLWKYSVVGVDGQTSSKYFPSLMKTPAGTAREEAAAYQLEISELQKLYDEAFKDCDKARGSPKRETEGRGLVMIDPCP
jgi:hypothetical protein